MLAQEECARINDRLDVTLAVDVGHKQNEKYTLFRKIRKYQKKYALDFMLISHVRNDQELTEII